MRINVAIPEAHVDAPVLNAALESVTRLNEEMLASGEVPTFTDGLKEGIKWKPEPPGDEHFDHAKTVLRRKWGDCDDLAPWQAASLRHTGEDPDARAIVRRSGPKRWHAIVRRGDGSVDDPSKAAGMGQPTGVVGAALPLMYTAPSAVVGGAYIVRPQIALRPFRGGAQARTDMPIHTGVSGHLQPSDYAMASIQHGATPQQALVGAIEGALQLAIAGGYAPQSHISRLAAIADAVEGIPLDEVAACYGEEHARAAAEVVGAFGFLKKSAKGLVKAMPMASKLVKFVPGVGPLASTALDVTSKLVQKRGGGGRAAPAPRGQGTPQSPVVPPPGPTNPFPSVESWARQGRLCIPATFE